MTRFERGLINSSTIVSGLSGTAYGVMKYFMSTDDPFAVVNHPFEPWALTIHILSSPAMLFAVALIAAEHIFPQVGRPGGRPCRGSGMILTACLVPMVATGYLIQVSTHETLRQASVVIHIATGMTYLAAFGVHLAVSRGLAPRLGTRVDSSSGGPGSALGVWRRTGAGRRTRWRHRHAKEV